MQTDINSGVTHDVVIHVNDSQRLGIIVRPMTYRLSATPRFAPQMTIGNQESVDQSWLRSFLFTFEQGFTADRVVDPARSHHIEFGSNMVINPEGEVLTSIMPTVMSAYNQVVMDMSTGHVKSFVMSGAPRMLIQGRGLYSYTNHAWVASHTNQNGINLTVQPLAAVMHSNVAVIATPNSGLLLYGDTGANKAARPYVSLFAKTQTTVINNYGFTQVDSVYNYDRRLWKIINNQVAYWDASLAKWSAWQDVGEATTKILNSETFIGRQFYGKADGLWAFDAGRIYQIEDYTPESSTENFALLHAFRGALYYNIGRRLLRYTAGGSIEELPWTAGTIRGGQAGMGLLLIWTDSADMGGDSIWGLNVETGALFPIFDAMSYRPPASRLSGDFALVEPSPGLVHLAPVQISQYGSSQAGNPAVMFEAGRQAWSKYQHNPVSNVPAIVGLPTVDFNLPSIVKQIVRVKVYYQMYSGDYIELHGEPYQDLAYPKGSVPKVWFGLVGGINDPNNAVAFRPADGLVLAGTSPFTSVTLVTRITGPDFYLGGTWQYETAPNVWANLVISSVTPLSSRPRYYNVTWVLPSDWVATSTYAPTAFHVRLMPPYTDDFVAAIVTSLFAPVLTLSQNVFAFRTLYATFRNSTVQEDSFVFTPPLSVHNLSMSLRMYANASGRARLRAVEFEYTIPDSDKLQVSLVAVATNGLERLDGVVENSAAFAAQTMMSLANAGVPRPVQLPFPFPTGHTRNMVLSLQGPGVYIPILSYAHSFLGGEYSVLLKEV